MTALRVEESTRHLVLEMGARHKGDIEYLTSITPPRIGLVLNVGTAHVGEFGSQEAIAEAKGELVEALPADGVAILNADDRLVRAMASRTKARVVYFGESAEAEVRARDVRLDSTGRPSFTLSTPAGSAPVQLRLYGEHHVSNALAAAAVATELGMTVDDTAEALSEAGALSRWRMEVVDRADGVTVVNDAYNANPDSMRAALRALISMGGAAWSAVAPGRCSARCGSSARTAWPSTTPSGGSRSGSTSPSWWRSADARRPAWNWARGTKVRGVRSRCWCPTRTRRSNCCAVSCGRGMWCW